MVQCSVCRKELEDDAVIKAGDYRVCGECKTVFFQRLREGLNLTGEMRYGGFWIRFMAQFVDGIILAVGGAILSFVLGLVLVFPGIAGLLVKGSIQLVIMILGIAYITYFIGHFGATLGKMACGLKVVRADGGKVDYSRAFGRYWATGLSSLTLSIGYLMAAFDDQKRALHDRICDTRVVRV